jgi:hypothetical protein
MSDLGVHVAPIHAFTFDYPGVHVRPARALKSAVAFELWPKNLLG